jgi:hypothetical protein
MCSHNNSLREDHCIFGSLRMSCCTALHCTYRASAAPAPTGEFEAAIYCTSVYSASRYCNKWPRCAALCSHPFVACRLAVHLGWLIPSEMVTGPTCHYRLSQYTVLSYIAVYCSLQYCLPHLHPLVDLGQPLVLFALEVNSTQVDQVDHYSSSTQLRVRTRYMLLMCHLKTKLPASCQVTWLAGEKVGHANALIWLNPNP